MKTQKRIKKVFSTSSQVLHLWANQAQSDARMSNCYFESESCYSYGSHYELGRIITYRGVQLAIVNNSGYSHTTAKHISEAQSALRGLMPYIAASTFDVREALVENQDKLIDRLMQPLNGLKFWASAKALDASERTEIHDFNKLCAQLKHNDLIIDVPADLEQLINSHIQYRLQRAVELQSPEAAAQREQARIRKENQLAVKNAESVEAWKRGEIGPTNYIRNLYPQIIRISVVNNSVVTSSGAEVPLPDALKLLRAIETGKAKSGTPIGSFTFNGVENGVATIGCHKIKITEAKRVLQNVGLRLVSGQVQ